MGPAVQGEEIIQPVNISQLLNREGSVKDHIGSIIRSKDIYAGGQY